MESKYCSQCGTKQSVNSKFCEKCGKSTANTQPIKKDPKPKKNLVVMVIIGILILLALLAGAAATYYFMVQVPKQNKLQNAKKVDQKSNIAIGQEFTLSDGTKLKISQAAVIDTGSGSYRGRIVEMELESSQKDLSAINMRIFQKDNELTQARRSNSGKKVSYDVPREEDKQYSIHFDDGSIVRLSGARYEDRTFYGEVKGLFDDLVPKQNTQTAPQPQYETPPAPSNVHCNSYDYGNSRSVDCYTY